MLTVQIVFKKLVFFVSLFNNHDFLNKILKYNKFVIYKDTLYITNCDSYRIIRPIRFESSEFVCEKDLCIL